MEQPGKVAGVFCDPVAPSVRPVHVGLAFGEVWCAPRWISSASRGDLMEEGSGVDAEGQLRYEVLALCMRAGSRKWDGVDSRTRESHNLQVRRLARCTSNG